MDLMKRIDKNLKYFFIKLISILVAIIIIINAAYNLILADKIEIINNLFDSNRKENISIIKNKIRNEIRKGIEKDKILDEQDKELIIELYKKIKNELKE